MKITKLVIIVPFLLYSTISSIDIHKFVILVEQHKAGVVSKEDLIKAYSEVQSEDKVVADNALEAFLQTSIDKLRGTEQYRSTFAKLVELYTEQQLRRSDLIAAYRLIEDADDKLLADQILAVRLRKSIDQLRRDERYKIPEYGARRAAVTTKPSRPPIARTKGVSRKATRRPTAPAQRHPRATRRKSAVQIGIESGPARTQKDIGVYYKRPRRAKPVPPTAPRKTFFQKAPGTRPDEQEALIVEDVPRADELEQLEQVDEQLSKDIAESLAEQIANGAEEADTSQNGAQRPDDQPAQNRAEEMKRRMELIRASASEKARQREEQSRSAAEREQARLRLQEYEAAQQARPQAPRPVAQREAPPQARPPVPHLEPEDIRRSRAQEMAKQMESIRPVQRSVGLVTVNRRPVVQFNKEHHFPSHQDFNKVLATVPIDTIKKIGKELVKENKTEEQRWEVIKELLNKYNEPLAPQDRLVLLTKDLVNAVNKQSDEYKALPNAFKN